MINKGDFVYVKRSGYPVQEGQVVSEGSPFEVRLEHNSTLIEVKQSELWTTFDSRRVAV